MLFTRLQDGHTCDCTSGAAEDISSVFSRRIKASQLQDSDFLSYCETGFAEKKSGDCDHKCRFRGVSINKFEEITRASVHKIYSEAHTFAPGVIRKFVVFRLKASSGLVRPTPTYKDDTHHTLFKKDDFGLDCLEVIAVEDIRNV